jgi:hypothetical protein
MKSTLVNISVLAWLLVWLVSSPVAGQDQLAWYKGNLHTHTYWSDGDEFPEMVLDWYQTNRYDFIALSDHNTVARDEKWIRVKKSPLYEESFRKYIDRFGADWVQYKTDSGRITVKLKTFEEYKGKMGSDRFLIIPSEEITGSVGNKPIHVNATNIRNFIPPPKANTIAQAMQQSVDAVVKQRAETGQSMLPHINHPNFFWSVTIEDMISLHGERFFEVYNGHPMVFNYGDSLHPGTEIIWDRINIAYAGRRQPLLYGLATDDSHNYHEFGKAFSNAGRGWIMVQAGALRADSLIRAMEAGRFYASTGITLKQIEFKDNELGVAIAPETGITYVIEFIGVEKNEKSSRVLKTTHGEIGSFTLKEEYLFVRTRITSSKLKPNPFHEGDFEMAWTQPVAWVIPK